MPMVHYNQLRGEANSFRTEHLIRWVGRGGGGKGREEANLAEKRNDLPRIPTSIPNVMDTDPLVYSQNDISSIIVWFYSKAGRGCGVGRDGVWRGRAML